MSTIGRKKHIDYREKIEPLYIKSIQANQIYMRDYAEENDSEIEYKVGKDDWIKFEKIQFRKAVLPDSLFLRYMKESKTANKKEQKEEDITSQDFIVLKFDYDAVFRINGNEEYKKDKHALREHYYKNGFTYRYVKKKKNDVGEIDIQYKMLMRTPGKAKKGQCIFIRDGLYVKAMDYLTMGFYKDIVEKNSDEPFKLVELSAYQTLTTATAQDYIQIPMKNILVVKDEEAYSAPMSANIVKSELVQHEKIEEEFEIDFDKYADQIEKILNKHSCTFDKGKADEKGWRYIPEKTKSSLKENGIRVNGGWKNYGEKKKKSVTWEVKECTVTESKNERIKNVLWDGMGLIDDSIFPEEMSGFIYCRSHFFKSCLFRGSLEKFFTDYCEEHGCDYNTHTVKDMFGNIVRLADVKVIITENSLKWLKFIGLMGGTEQKAYKEYCRIMKKYEDMFAIVKTAHKSKWEDCQLSTYQFNNSLPTTDKEILEKVTDCSVNYINRLKTDDKFYLQYLERKQNSFNINEVIVELVRWNPEFMKTKLFRTKKTKDISKLKMDLKEGRLLQEGDNLTIMDNPLALLMKAVGENPLEENCFEVKEDGVQCYAPLFENGTSLAAFRSPHNSPNNIVHLYNVYPGKLLKYFPNIGDNVIVFNAIGTDTQPRLSGHDVDSDSVYVTNQKELAELAKQAYIHYPTIINKVDEIGTNNYHFCMEDYAKMDNMIADAQSSIGTSTDAAQLALSYYYNGNMEDKELEKCFVILSVIGQISIDLAKRVFDIDVVKEIRRIKRLPCMRNNIVPRFFYDTKKSRGKIKDEDSKKFEKFNCPMDIMADIIDKRTIGYSQRSSDGHKKVIDLFDKTVIGTGNRYRKNKILDTAKEYHQKIKELYRRKDTGEIEESEFYFIGERDTNNFLKKVSKHLDQETVMQILKDAFLEENKSFRPVILNFLYKEHKEKFLCCFRKGTKNEKNLQNLS